MEKNRKSFSKIKLIIAMILAVGVCVLCYYENNHLVVSNYCFLSEMVPEEFDGFKIVHISDLHNKSFGKANEKLISRISEQNPDIIVITGDIIDSYRTDIEVAVEFVREASKICPVYYSTGNHEHRLLDIRYEELMQGITDAGGIVLDNEKVDIRNQDADLALVGVDDSYLQGDMMKKLLEGNEKLSIVLAHEPDYLTRYAESGANLVLSGHAHGGQFRIPGLGGLVAPGQGIFPKLTEGMHESGNTRMIISRGLGNSIIPIRLFNEPEIVCIELKSK